MGKGFLSLSYSAFVAGRPPCRNGAVATGNKYQLQILRLQRKTQPGERPGTQLALGCASEAGGYGTHLRAPPTEEVLQLEERQGGLRSTTRAVRTTGWTEPGLFLGHYICLIQLTNLTQN